MKYKFQIANIDDAKAIADIESEHFDEGIAYTEDFVKNWMNYNSEMFYVVKDENGNVVAHTILVPVTSECYDKLRKNLVHDMLEFNKDDVLDNKDSDYYYAASIAVKKEAIRKISVLSSLISGIIQYFSEYGHYIITTPITKAGLTITQSLGYKAINGENVINNNYEIVIESEVRARFARFTRRKK